MTIPDKVEAGPYQWRGPHGANDAAAFKGLLIRRLISDLARDCRPQVVRARRGQSLRKSPQQIAILGACKDLEADQPRLIRFAAGTRLQAF